MSEDDDAPLTVGTIRGLIEDILSKKDNDTATRRAGSRAVESRLDRNSEIEGAVEKAIAQLRSTEERQRKESEHAERLASVEKKLEEAPVERTPLHKLMGWGD